MSTHYYIDGDSFTPVTAANSPMTETLPPGNYVVKARPFTGALYLSKVEPFVLPAKTYGEVTNRVARILKTFADRPLNTGVLLSGEKGSGKTLLAKQLSVTAADAGIPTILVNSPMGGDAFSTFVQMIEQPVILLFDEFEKVYGNGNSVDEDGDPIPSGGNAKKNQESILTLLDGVFPSKKLFVFTVNSKWAVDDKMINRPGRVYYHHEFSGLSEPFIREYCEDNLKARHRTDGVVMLTQIYDPFNFDQLKAVVEEMNRYNETAIQVVEVLNLEVSKLRTRYKIDVLKEGKTVLSELSSDSVHASPLTGRFNYHLPNEECLRLDPGCIVSMDRSSGVIKMHKDGYDIILTKEDDSGFDYTRFLSSAY